MRLWSLHPKYLDNKGLIALWREALLAQKVLSGKTKGYKNHPQLERFKKCKKPLSVIGYYLGGVLQEGKKRKYKFDRRKILVLPGDIPIINVSRGQVLFELKHLKRKIKDRSSGIYKDFIKTKRIDLHPLFKVKPGPIEYWEKAA